MENADFALQWLNYLGISIYNKGVRILKYDGEPTYEIKPLDTKIRIGQDIPDEEGETKYKTMQFSELQERGLAIRALSNFKRWRPKQSRAYELMKLQHDSFSISPTAFKSSGMKIEHDPKNKRVRLIGENVVADPKSRVDSGIGTWMNYGYDAPKDKTKGPKKEVILCANDVYGMLQGRVFGHLEKSEDFMKINEIPLGITDDKDIICMPKMESPSECQRLIVIGSSGFGKSLYTNALSSRLLYSGDRVAWLIDPMNQFYNISYPQNNKTFNVMNGIIGDEPRPIPALQLYMACRYNYIPPNPNVSMTLTQNFLEFLRKYKYYTYNIKEFDVEGTIRYLPDWIEDIKDAETGEDIKEAIYSKVPNIQKDQGMQAMAYKWKNTFDTIFRERFTSNMYKKDINATDELEIVFEKNNKMGVKEGTRMKGHPFIMAMEAGLIPIINVSNARRQRWIRNYLADLMNKIVAHQMSVESNGLKKNRFWIIADELNEIYEKGKAKDNAANAFQELYRQGRFNNIGFIGNTQSLEKLEPEMYKNASYICCFNLRMKKERKQLTDFGVDKEICDTIGDLKALEMMIFRTPKYPLVAYDRWGRKKIYKDNDRNWMKLKIFPPINYHKVAE